MNAIREKVQEKLDALTRKWWLYPLLLLLFFIRPYASGGYDATQSPDVVLQALSHPLIYRFSALMPIAKAIPVFLIGGLLALGNRVRPMFNGYVGILYTALAFFQHVALTDKYGLVIISGNLALILPVALLWIWEAFIERNDFQPHRRPLWRWWVAPLVILSLLAPVDTNTMSPDFRPLRLLTNEAGLTYCMITPVILAVMTLHYPTVNLPVLRVSSFVGMIFGVVNMLVWFFVMPSGWWMGVLHIPLLAISIYAFVLSLGERSAPHP
jgi:hypothetical protein